MGLLLALLLLGVHPAPLAAVASDSPAIVPHSDPIRHAGPLAMAAPPPAESPRPAVAARPAVEEQLAPEERLSPEERFGAVGVAPALPEPPREPPPEPPERGEAPPLREAALPPAPLAWRGLPMPAPRYTPAETCQRIGNKLGSVSIGDCLDVGLAPTGGVSNEGVPLLVKEYPPLPEREPLGRVLLLGGIHGDEYSSVSIVFKWMEILDRHHSGLFHWRIVPLTNPDGLLRPRSQRMNSHGVDLNRNFPTPRWEAESSDYWTRRTRRDPRRYPGPSAASEPETRWVAQELASFRPHVVISVHAPYGLLDFDGPPAHPPKQLGHLFLEPLGTFPGSLGRYAWGNRNTPVVTIELPHAGIMPTPEQVSTIWVDLVRWLVHNVPRSQPAGATYAARGVTNTPEDQPETP